MFETLNNFQVKWVWIKVHIKGIPIIHFIQPLKDLSCSLVAPLKWKGLCVFSEKLTPYSLSRVTQLYIESLVSGISQLFLLIQFFLHVSASQKSLTYIKQKEIFYFPRAANKNLELYINDSSGSGLVTWLTLTLNHCGQVYVPFSLNNS